MITINEQELTATILDNAENPTKHCVIGNWNPIALRKWLNKDELQQFAESIQGDDRYFVPLSPAE